MVGRSPNPSHIHTPFLHYPDTPGDGQVLEMTSSAEDVDPPSAEALHAEKDRMALLHTAVVIAEGDVQYETDDYAPSDGDEETLEVEEEDDKEDNEESKEQKDKTGKRKYSAGSSQKDTQEDNSSKHHHFNSSSQEY
jgi:hypothetical protein